MKKIVLMLALVTGIGYAATAQEAQKTRTKVTPEQRAERQAERMKEALQLTEDQKKAIYELNLQSANKIKAYKKDQRDANKDQFKKMRDEREAKMKSILTPEQYEKHQAMKAERMKKMNERKANLKARKMPPTRKKVKPGSSNKHNNHF